MGHPNMPVAEPSLGFPESASGGFFLHNGDLGVCPVMFEAFPLSVSVPMPRCSDSDQSWDSSFCHFLSITSDLSVGIAKYNTTCNVSNTSIESQCGAWSQAVTSSLGARARGWLARHHPDVSHAVRY